RIACFTLQLLRVRRLSPVERSRFVDAVFRRSLALQFMPIKRHAQYNADRMRPREKLSRRQSFVGAVSENGNDGYRKMFKQHSNARREFLKFPAGRAFTFGKPNQVAFLFQNDRAKGQARTRGARWFDR